MIVRKILSALVFTFFFLLIQASGYAQDGENVPTLPSEPKEIQKFLEEKQKALEEIEVSILSKETDSETLSLRRQDIKDLRLSVSALTDAIKPKQKRIAADLKDLGPAPVQVEGEPFTPEPESIQKLRTSLGEEARTLEGLAIQADALVSKTLRLQERIVILRRDSFLSRILERQPPPFRSDLWSAAVENYYAQSSNFLNSLKVIQEQNPSYPALIASLVFFMMLLFLGRIYSLRSLVKKIKEDDVQGQRSCFSRASVSSLFSMIVTVAGLSFIQQSFIAQGVVHDGNLAFSTQLIFLSCFLIFAFIITGRFKAAGIIRATTQWVACLIAFLYALDQIALEFGNNMGSGVEFAVLQSYVITSIFAVLVMIGSVLAYRAGETKSRFIIPQNAFLFFAAGSAFLLAANLFGYVALSRVIFEKFVVLVSFLTFILMVRSVARSFLRQIDSAFHKPHADEEKEDERLVLFWLGLSLDLVILLLCLPLTAGLVGVDWQEVEEWAYHAFWGFNVGNANISLATITIGLGVFLVLLFATRLFQRVLRDNILPKTRLDFSIRQSLIQLLGYLGLIVAMMAGVSAVGFDLTNLALIAGALSVGIGFGLQSIVSNFVSGLILLFERPIKVGDWVIVGSGEGIVKKISVRATEIETFDRTSIIVPNSELISSSVKNWNYNDRIGRVVISVGVSYNSNPRKVRDILLECAQEHPSVLSHPSAHVLFKDFGDSALIFDLRVFIRNIRDIYDVSTDLRFMIWDKLHEENIEIPFPQRDLHIKTPTNVIEIVPHAALKTEGKNGG